MRVSLCVGEYATIPYYIAGLEIPVYSMEELSFCLKENAFLLDMSLMRDELVEWVDTQCGLPDLAGELHRLIHRQGTLSGFVLTILQYVGFYDADEIAEVDEILRKGAGLSTIERRKGQVDYLVRQKKYEAAVRGYDGLLAAWEESARSQGELPAAKVKGAILHNKGVALIGMMFYDEAANQFRAAYDVDGEMAHYNAYLATKRLQLDEKAYIAFAAEQTIGYEQTLALERRMEGLLEDWKIQPEFQDILTAKELRKDGKRQQYLEETDRLLWGLKAAYRNSVGE
ncbi:MAG: hypothetical protein IJ747_04535 [Lachnospiraceae bacterium]|nr:hypothetical protein [Lachnospiraceae bacterium]